MTSRFARVAAVAAATALASGALVAGVVSPASAAVNTTRLGGLDIPNTFSNTDTFSAVSSAGCSLTDPSGRAINRYNVLINGPGWTNVIFTSTTGAGFSTTNPISAGAADSLEGIRIGEGLATMNGLYTLTMNCTNSTADIAGVFTGSFFTSNGTAFSEVATPATTTTLSVPATATVGDSVTLTATTTPNGAAGNVEFFRAGNVSLGTAPVSGGTASLSLNNLPIGASSITAVFTPTNAAPPADQNQPSTSAAATVTVAKANAAVTASIAPAGNVTTSDPVTLTCSVAGSASAGAVAGNVTFTYTLPGAASATTSAAIALGGSPTNGSAQLALGTLGAGNLSGVTCDYAGNGNYNAGASAVLADKAVTDQAAASRVATEFIRTTVNAGALTLAVAGYPRPNPDNTTAPQNPTTPNGTPVNDPSYPYATPGTGATNVVILPAANLNSAGTLIVTSGNIIPVVAVDTRAGDPGYVVTGKVSEFVGAGFATDTNAVTKPNRKINAANLGWSPQFISSTRFPAAASASAAGLVIGGIVAPANGVLPGDPSTAGLATDRTLYTAPYSAGSGTVVFGANVSLQAPTTTVADDYQATLTLTAIG